MLPPWKKIYDQPRQHIQKQRHYFANKGPSSQRYGFSSSHVWMWELNYKENWALRNWCFWTVVMKRLLRVHWTARRSYQSVLKEISTEYSLEGLMLKLELKLQTLAIWYEELTHLKRPWCWERLKVGRGRGRTEDEMVGWHHRLDGHEFEQAPGDGEGQGGLACCSPWDHKESETTEGLNNNKAHEKMLITASY